MKLLNERVAHLECEITRGATCPLFMDNPMLLSPEQMGFFDGV